jgi:hypothetical protein
MVMKRLMVAFLIQLLLVIRSWFARRARLEAENQVDADASRAREEFDVAS